MTAETPVFIGLVQDGKVRLDFPKQFAAYAKRFEGDEIEIELRKRRVKRSARQNRALWALLNTWAQEGGHNVNDLKDDVMGEVFGWSETRSPLTGRQVPNRARSSQLSVQEFCLLIERILEIAAECGVWLLAPDEYRKAKDAEAKNAARQRDRAQRQPAA